ncbi:MAG TPA: hypothetical protein VKU01_00065 [Bryobacteraceae bacterium]|nr:hypothetical protein [Bryobacteraceae bacterium]
MSLVFVAAEAIEFAGILRHAQSIKKLEWSLQFARQAEMNGRPIVLVADGPGPKLAARAANEARERLEVVEAFISTGFCGALDREAHRGDVFLATAVNGEIVDRPSSPGPSRLGHLVSQDRVACTVSEKSSLRDGGSSAVEMEAAGVMRVARESGIPFYCLRVVTDTASEDFPLDFNAMRDRDGRFSRARIVAAACRHPVRIFPRLMELQRTSKEASIALGDFIANCRF